MFNVSIFEIDLPFVIRDYDGTATIDSGSDNTTILVTPEITTLDWVGMWIVITSGTLSGYMAQIAGYAENAGTYSFSLSQEMPSTPEQGSTFKIISLHETNNSISFNGTIYDISKYVDGVSFSTDINSGYARGGVALKRNSFEFASIVNSLLGHYMIISDYKGKDVYHGIIAGIDIDGEGGNIEAIGIGLTHGWFQFFGVYDTTPTNTAVKIIKDALSLNPYIDQTYQQIDNNAEFDTAQQAVGGIGPLTFTQSNVTTKTVLEKVLGMGNYGMINDPTKEAFLQVWDYGVPTLMFGNSDPAIADAKWVIGNHNLGAGKQNMSIVGDIAESYSTTGASYNSEAGDPIEIAGYTNIQMLDRFGIKRREVASGQSRELTFAIAKVSAQDNNKISGPGKINIEGDVRSWGANSFHSPAYMIRAGDIILLEDPVTGSGILQNESYSPGIFEVGTTSYSDGKMSIGINKIAYVSDIFKKQIDVEQVA